MKQVIYHWVEMRTLEVPDEAPTDDIYKLQDWIYKQGKSVDDYTASSKTRDCEIVDVQEIQEGG